MGHYAKVENGVVTQVIVADFEWVQNNLQGDWHDLGGDPLTVGIGYTYDPEADAFIAPRPQCGHLELFLNHLYKWTCQECAKYAYEL